MFHYWAYGLKLDSELFFPELIPIDGSGLPDLQIRIAPNINSSSEEYEQSKSSVLIEESFYKLLIPKVAIYEVAHGSRITITPFEHASDDAIRLFCLSNAFAALLQQKGLIPLHCAAVKSAEKTTLIFGNSGSGKSSTLVGLMERGFQVITDDVVVPIILEGAVLVHSSYPMIKLWKETVDRFGLWSRVDRKIRPDMEKYGLYYHDSFSCDSFKPSKAIFLEATPEKGKVISRIIDGVELFTRLDANVYRGEYLGHMNVQKEHFQILSFLGNQLNAHVVSRPLNHDSFNDTIEAAVEIINK